MVENVKHFTFFFFFFPFLILLYEFGFVFFKYIYNLKYSHKESLFYRYEVDSSFYSLLLYLLLHVVTCFLPLETDNLNDLVLLACDVSFSLDLSTYECNFSYFRHNGRHAFQCKLICSTLFFFFLHIHI